MDGIAIRRCVSSGVPTMRRAWPPASRRATAQTLDPHRMADPSIQLHALHFPALCTPHKELSADAFLLRRNQTFWPASMRDFLSGAYNPIVKLVGEEYGFSA